jgi:2-octaprenylphenol hydroxylase
MDFDVLIVGGGLVGASLACALQDLRVAMIDESLRKALPAGAAFDVRVYALSPANVGFLREIGAWDRIPRSAVTPVHGMQVHGDASGATLDFDAWESGAPELAWIVEDGRLQSALRDALSQRPGVELIAPARCASLALDPRQATLSLEDGRQLRARLVVGADGAGSFVRRAAGIAVRDAAYAQCAVVANFACDLPHRNVARQWFLGGPVLALLPLPGRHVSMVWSVDAQEAVRLEQLSPAALCDAVAEASNGAPGALSLVTPPVSFPLRRLDAREAVRERIALIGDAAHVVHPLAGQGANLGFQDARVLAGVLAAREPGRDPGERALLRRYERERAEAILAMSGTIHGLFALFGSTAPAMRRLRNAGLKLVDRSDVLKNLLMRQAMH